MKRSDQRARSPFSATPQLPADAPTEARALLDVQLILLNDPALIEGAKSRVENERLNIEWAILLYCRKCMHVR